MPSPIVPSDLLRLVGVAEPQCARDGRVVFRRWWFAREADRIVCTLWRTGPDGDAHALTNGTNDRLPRISPDGRQLAFVREVEGTKARVHLLRLDGGEARAVGETYPGISGMAWSPDGTRLAISATAPHDPKRARQYHDERSGARHIRALPFKYDPEGLFDGTRKHIAVIDVAGGNARWITSGDFDAGPPAWSPDGRTIAYADRFGRDETITALADVFVVDADGGTPRAVTAGDGPAMLPAFSHDGHEIAYIGHRHGDDNGGRFDSELLVVDVASGAIRSLSATLGRTVGDAVAGDLRGGATVAPMWTGDDRAVVVQVGDDGATSVRAFARDGSGSEVLAGGERHVYSFDLAADGTLALAVSTPTLPGDLFLVDGGTERRITSVNDAWLSERVVIAPERYRPVAADGTRLDAWLLRPSNPSGDVPLVIEVHGGPHGAYGASFFMEFQALAGAGIAVAYGNPRGSQTYGHAYADAILGDWGGLDVADVLTILDGALERGGFDRARLGVAGGSYGGFMATFLLGHTDRFTAGVSMRAVNDFVSEMHASDIGWFLERELGMRYADAAAKLFERSPIRRAANIEAALLVEHSERDYRCPIDQGEQLFTIMRRFGKTKTEFVRFVGDGHELSRSGKPRARVLRLRAIVQWFVRHLRPAGVTPPAEEAGALFRPLPGEAEIEDVAVPA